MAHGTGIDLHEAADRSFLKVVRKASNTFGTVPAEIDKKKKKGKKLEYGNKKKSKWKKKKLCS